MSERTTCVIVGVTTVVLTLVLTFQKVYAPDKYAPFFYFKPMGAAWNFQDLTGEVFSKLTVIRLNVGDHHDRTRWDCKCDCGGYKTVMAKDLKCGKVKSCGCLKGGREFIEMIGLKFGKLTVTSLHSRGSNIFTKWNCICDCGNTAVVYGANLRKKNNTTSCGCAQKEITSKTKKTHGCYALSRRLAGIWYKMRKRCNSPKESSYYKYGGRGISVCKEWNESAAVFAEWAINNGYDDKLTIDRIDNNGNYEPSNCRWVTVQENSQNTRFSLGVKKVTEIKYLLRERIPIKKIARMYGVGHGTISSIKTGRYYSNVTLPQ